LKDVKEKLILNLHDLYKKYSEKLLEELIVKDPY